MIRNILNLTVEDNLLKRLTRKSYGLYKSTIRAKKKWGKPQQNNDGTLRYRYTQEPYIKLKLIQREINILLQKIPLPDVMFGSIKGKNNIMNAVVHINSSYFLTVDLKNYFSNITNAQVHQTLLSIGFSSSEARLLTRLTTFDGHLPQGAPTSATLANLVFSTTAQNITSYCENKQITFTAYLDDLAFSSSKNFKEYIPEILEIIKQNGYYLNHKKICYRRRSCEVTGLFIRRGQLHLKKEMQENLENLGVRRYAERVAHFNGLIRNKISLSEN
ncbi:MAG: RNA-directed DNA polymerase [Pedobacter sp.]|nr:MAG: RNA-directed DNA polymerase [Pedobacter sp.]